MVPFIYAGELNLKEKREMTKRIKEKGEGDAENRKHWLELKH